MLHAPPDGAHHPLCHKDGAAVAGGYTPVAGAALASAGMGTPDQLPELGQGESGCPAQSERMQVRVDILAGPVFGHLTVAVEDARMPVEIAQLPLQRQDLVEMIKDPFRLAVGDLAPNDGRMAAEGFGTH